MGCDEFRSHLDAYLDGEMDKQQAEAFARHAKACENCEHTLRSAEVIKECLWGMDDEITIPLSAQAAWRARIRAEAKRRGSRAWLRAASSLAAAFVVLAGATAAFRATGRIGGIKETDSGLHTPEATPAIYAQEDGAARAVSFSAVVEADGETAQAPEGAVIMGDSAPADAAAPEAEPSRSRVLIQSAVREMEAEDFDQAYGLISDLVNEYGGYFRANAIETKDGARTATMEVCVPKDDLAAFLSAATRTATVVRSEDNTSDISGEVYDAESRLASLQSEKARLGDLVAAATDADVLADLRKQLEDVYLSIDAVQSRIGAFQNQLKDANVTFKLYEGKAPAADETEIVTADTSLGGKMAAAFKESGRFLQDMALSLAIIAPFALAALGLAAVAWVIVLITRRGKKRE